MANGPGGGGVQGQPGFNPSPFGPGTGQGIMGGGAPGGAPGGMGSGFGASPFVGSTPTPAGYMTGGSPAMGPGGGQHVANMVRRMTQPMDAPPAPQDNWQAPVQQYMQANPGANLSPNVAGSSYGNFNTWLQQNHPELYAPGNVPVGQAASTFGYGQGTTPGMSNPTFRT